MQEEVAHEIGSSAVAVSIASHVSNKRIHLKRVIDIVGASIFFLLFGIPYLIFWCCVLWTTGAPAIYRHQRVGMNGVEFDCLKFRSMVPDSDRVLQELLASDPNALAEWNETFKLKNDPRVTRFGSFMRKSSLDELPQFWNVLRGDMSLVGPRPVVQKELDCFYGPAAKIYSSVKPGITGLWQIGGRSDLSYTTRVALDCSYVKNWSLIGDFKIIYKTVKVVVSGNGSY